MQHPILTAQKREMLGKKVKQLRKAGKMPATVYGKNIPSQSIEVDYKTFLHLYDEVGETGIIDLTVDGKAVPVLIKNPQVTYRSNQPIHVDFFQVNLKEKIKTFVPVTLLGEPTPVTEKQGLLMQNLNEIEIEALPEELPEAIEVATDILQSVGDVIRVADIKAPANVTILTDPEQQVAQISELVSAEPEPEPTTEAEAPVEEEAPTEGTEPLTETPAATPSEEK